MEDGRPRSYPRRVFDSDDEEDLAKLPTAESCGAGGKGYVPVCSTSPT